MSGFSVPELTACAGRGMSLPMAESAGHRWRRAVLGAVMAYALAIQALLSAFGGALHAGTLAGPEAFLCAPGQTASQDPAPSKPHDGLCCLVSCHGAGSAAPAPIHTALEQPPLSGALAEALGKAPLPDLTSAVFPVGSRAPPRLG